MKTIGLFAVGATIILATACAVPAESDSLQESTDSTRAEASSEGASGAEAAEDTVFIQTVVNVKEDGLHEISDSPITLSQQLAENEMRRAQAAGIPVQRTMGLDTGCAGSSNWMYDQPATPHPSIPGEYNFVGNRVCINFPAYMCEDVDLSTVNRGASFVCGGKTYNPKWSAGPMGCLDPFAGTVLYGVAGSNFVRAIWTGTARSTGVGFYNGTTNVGSFPGYNTKYPDVNTAGRLVRTCGTIIN